MSDFEENYEVLIENFKLWEHKNIYVELMEQFLNNTIDGRQFETEFYKLWYRDIERHYSSKELLQIARQIDLNQFKGYSHILSKLFTDCDVFEPDLVLRDDSEISEEELRDCVKKALLEIKNNYA